MTSITWKNGTRKLSQLIPWDVNPRQLTERQAEHLETSLRKFGLAQPFLISPNNDIYDGHQRQALMDIMHEYGHDAVIDVRVSSRLLTDDERRELVVRLHENTGEWDYDALANVYDVEELGEWGFPEWKIDEFMPDDDYDSGTEAGAQPNPRKLPIDVIYTAGSYGNPTDDPKYILTHCCIAVASGFLYGVQTDPIDKLSGGVCAGALFKDSHKPQFIDCQYTHYDHSLHLDAVKKWRPKYATVRDVMTEKQCRKAGISYYSLDRILGWAEELSNYADYVIVIPKYDCIDQIPDKFVLGYSVPTSHWGTPLNVDLFRGRRVHLLGGSWKKQLEYMAVLGDDVVSLDNNYIQKQAKFGSFVYPNGDSGNLEEDLGIVGNNPMYSAIAISLGNMGAKINELYSAVEEPA